MINYLRTNYKIFTRDGPDVLDYDGELQTLEQVRKYVRDEIKRRRQDYGECAPDYFVVFEITPRQLTPEELA